MYFNLFIKNKIKIIFLIYINTITRNIYLLKFSSKYNLFVLEFIDISGNQVKEENKSSDPNDFGVSLTERIKRRKRAAQSSEVNEKNDESNNFIFY